MNRIIIYLKIAFMNIIKRSFLIKINLIIMIIFIIVFYLGNLIIDSTKIGIKGVFVDYFTSNVVIHSFIGQDSAIFSTRVNNEKSPIIENYGNIKSKLNSDTRIDKFTGLIVTYGYLSTEDDTFFDENSLAIIFGVDTINYFDLFPSIKIVEKNTDEYNCNKIFLTKGQIYDLSNKYNKNISLGSKLLITGEGINNFRICEVEVKAIIDIGDNSSMNSPLYYVDINTARLLNGLINIRKEKMDYKIEQLELIDKFDEETFFLSIDDQFIKLDSKNKELIDDSFKNNNQNIEVIEETWNYILIKTNYEKEVINYYSNWFKENNMNNEIMNWEKAAGYFGHIINIIRIIFNIIILIISLITLIIMINILVLTIFERQREIGIMRIIGGEKSNILFLYFIEIFLITTISYIIAITISEVFIFFINKSLIKVTNELLILLFGSEYINLNSNKNYWFPIYIITLLFSLLSYIYPIIISINRKLIDID